MTLSSPDQSVTHEQTVQAEEMQGMAKDMLTVAQDIIKKERLDTTPNGSNFAWTVFGRERGQGFMASHSAIDLHEVAETGTKSSLAEQDRRIAQVTDPETKKQAMASRDIYARSLGLGFEGVSDAPLGMLYGSNMYVPSGLVNLFAQRLGFTQTGERVDDVNNTKLKQNGNEFTIDHPDKPFTLVLPIQGVTNYGRPDIRSFVVRYAPK